MASRMWPAANIMIGPFWAKSMMFAETFHRVGSMQVGGTARMYQIPFFAALCDYVLIGEEMFAAGDYLALKSRLRSLRVQVEAAEDI